MPLDKEKIRDLILSGDEYFGESEEQEICSGVINHNDLGKLKYTVTHGYNANKAFLCQMDWHSFRKSVYDFIDSQNYTDEELDEIFSKLSIEDSHWDWFGKAISFYTDEFEWFFLSIEEEVQGICIIRHPCDSELSENNIFYIEFIATAPWNRYNPYQPKKYSQIGSNLIFCILAFAVDHLKLHCGCNLHSLPKAERFYDKLGMQKLDNLSKGQMSFFELPEENALKLIGRL